MDFSLTGALGILNALKEKCKYIYAAMATEDDKETYRELQDVCQQLSDLGNQLTLHYKMVSNYGFE
jgi:hypothetical protein